MSDPTNDERAMHAEAGLEAFLDASGGPRKDMEESIGDLITDLLHMAKREGVYVPRVLRCAANDYLIESADDPVLQDEVHQRLRKKLEAVSGHRYAGGRYIKDNLENLMDDERWSADTALDIACVLLHDHVRDGDYILNQFEHYTAEQLGDAEVDDA